MGIPRCRMLPSMAEWSFLSPHARVVLCLAEDPTARLREIGDCAGMTERAAHRIVSELCSSGYVTRERVGRRNHYSLTLGLPLRGAPDGTTVADLLGLLPAGAGASHGELSPSLA